MSRFYDALREASRLQPLNGNRDGTVRKGADQHAGEHANSRKEDDSTSDSPVVAEPASVHEDALRLGVPQNGTGAAIRTSLDRKARLIPHAADSVIVEHYRRLRTKLLQEHQARPFRLLMIASPNPQEGKTVTTFNLALSFSMLPSCKVLIVDGDLRKGSLGKWLAVDGQPGLSNLIEGSATIDEVILKCDELPMHFVLRGNSKAPAAELLNSPRAKEYFRQMAEKFDLVLVDSPPLNLVADAQLLAHCCDAVLLVARAFSTTRKVFEKAVQDLQTFRIIGAVLNGGTRGQLYRRYNHYY